MPTVPETPLAARLRARIAAEGPITFAEFMRAALYDPEHGYYASGRAAIGRKGDFITSVSVGPLFGRLLARQFGMWWEELGRPADFTLVEQGAHDGRLAADLLEGLRAQNPACFAAARYVAIEPSPRWRAKQAEQLAAFAEKTSWVSEPGELRDLTGVAFSNELLDAFPVHRIRREGGTWRERHVALEGEAFTWHDGDLSSHALREHLAQLPPASDGYETEVNLFTAPWTRSSAAALRRGYLLVIDYGYERAEYYRPERAHGTLSGYAAHGRADDFLARPGEIDLTAHVDFTTLLETAETEGLRLAGFTDQHRFLASLGAAYFTSSGTEANRAQELRAFKTLMHPELLGAAFKVVWFTKA
jgi:SAM-dependent MidA family methyltransferase